MPQLVILDNDGVLVDSEPIANRILADLLTEAGVPTSYEDALRDYMGGSLGRVHEVVRERTGTVLPADLSDRYHARLFDSFRTELRPVRGAAELIDALARAGVLYCVASSGTHERIRLALDRVGLLDRFTDRTIFSSADVDRGKPAPDLFLHAAAAMGADPSRCVVIEDSAAGVRAALAAGMTVYGYAGMTPADRLAGAHEIVTDLAELHPLIFNDGNKSAAGDPRLGQSN